MIKEGFSQTSPQSLLVTNVTKYLITHKSLQLYFCNNLYCNYFNLFCNKCIIKHYVCFFKINLHIEKKYKLKYFVCTFLFFKSN